MNTTPNVGPRDPRPFPRNSLGVIGLAIGLIALVIAIFQNDLRPPPAEDNRTLTEVAGDAARKLIKEKILKEDPDDPKPIPIHETRHDSVAIAYMALGFVAMALGIISWIRKDHIRLSGGAIAVGLVAVGWEFVLIGLLIAVVILVVANFSA